MSRASQVRRLFRYSALAFFGVLIILIGTLRTQQWILRRRAERLLADVQEIELRKTSFEDAQKLFGRWSKWGHYEGECTRRRCLFSIMFSDFLDGHPSLFKRASLSFLYSALGGTPTDVYAGVTVIDGVVWEKLFGFGTSARGFLRAGAQASTVSWLPASDERFSLHPNHAVVPYNLKPCVWMVANFTPYEDTAEVRRLMGFNLASVTRWGFAREKDDVMPAACDEARREQPLVVPPDKRSDLPRHESLEYLARDAGKVAVVKVISKPNESGDPWNPWKLEMRLEEPLKRYSPHDVGTIQELLLRCSDVNWVPDTRVGERYLIFTWWAPESNTVVCGGIEPVTEANLAATRRGIAQDYKALFGEPYR